MAPRVKVRNDRLTKIIAKTIKADGLRASIGIQDSEAAGDHDGIDNANLGAVHEFGAPSVGIPERSFMRAPFDAGLSTEILDECVPFSGNFEQFFGIGNLHLACALYGNTLQVF